MILIIGGAYQGKFDYAKEHYNVSFEEVFSCKETLDIDFNKKVVKDFHLLILEQIKAGRNPISYLQENMEKLNGKIIICDDISCGVVPIDKTMRLWREYLGNILALLSKQSSEVVRVFCGLGMKIK